ncbi:NTF2-related export protein 2 isoform X1 [Orcinus orca]|uniref:NTF2-related export protein 2 isoform X1 n=1 Tax=Orcinus orca TaxID=9733 RepID=UPI002112CDC7|nr:NTF2-related export protein 2 isoform X1 [Orcinus orca]
MRKSSSSSSSQGDRERHQGDRERHQGDRGDAYEQPHTSHGRQESRTRRDSGNPAEEAAGTTPMARPMDFKIYVDQACKAAEEFVNIYYETMDKRRQALTRLYLDKATLVWNGNVVTGLEALTKFFDVLPSSEFQVNMLDCQPVHEQATQAQATVLVVTSGTVKFDGNRQHYFNQNFLLTAQSTADNIVWKIASDCFRFQDWESS